MVVSDAFTREALGGRVFRALERRGNVCEHVWEHPRFTPEDVDEQMGEAHDAQASVAVSSGTISDSVKYGSLSTGRDYSVFVTSPLNAYTTPTPSISR